MTVATLRLRDSGARLAASARYFQMTRPPSALPALDGLRACAIVLVLLRHAARPFHPHVAPLLPLGTWDLATPMINGWMGVDLFFVLSGFLITHHICQRYAGRFDRRRLLDYVRRRLFRIAPAYYTVLLLVAAGAVPYYPVAPERLGERVGYHLLFMQDYLPADIVVVFWSLGVEEKFYLVAPLLLMGVLACRRRSIRYGVLAVLAFCPMLLRALTWLGSPPRLDYEGFFMLFRSPFHASFDGLAVGTLCALLYRDRARLPALQRPAITTGLFWSGAAVVGGLLGVRPLLNQIDLFDAVFLQAVLALAMGAIVLAVALGGGPQRGLSRHGLFVISKLSYALYLTHYAVIPAVEVAVASMIDTTTTPRAVQLALFFPPYLAASIGTAAALHYLVEKPFLLLRDHRAYG